LHAESSFDFLNRVAGDYWDQPRALVEEWAMNLKGDGDYQQTRKAIRSGIDDQFRSALLELYLHEVFIRGGFDIWGVTLFVDGRYQEGTAGRDVYESQEVH